MQEVMPILPLNDLLEENAPDAMADIPEYMWKATTINGNIYGNAGFTDLCEK